MEAQKISNSQNSLENKNTFGVATFCVSSFSIATAK